MKRLITRIKVCWEIARAAWAVSKITPSIHWHLVGFTTYSEYEIIFKELHAAHLAYREKLEVYHKSLKRRVLVSKQKRDEKGRFIK